MNIFAALKYLTNRSLVNYFTPTSQAPVIVDTPTASPTYSLSARGNRTRQNQPIPVIYGRHIVYPDLASTPYYTYEDNEQYFYQLHCIGQGEFDEIKAKDIRIENTPITSFKDIIHQVFNPGKDIKHLNTNVYSVGKVAGQELDKKDEWFGPFAANPPKTKTNQIQIDVTFPQGLYTQTNDGGLGSKAVEWKVQWHPIDDEGTGTGEWNNPEIESMSAATPTAQSKTYTYEVPEGRYEVRLTRTNDKSTGSTHVVVENLHWKGLKSRITSPTATGYKDVTLLATRMKVTENLSQQAHKINCIVTRKLPSSYTTAQTLSPTLSPTRSIGLALLDICRQGGLTDSQIDIAALQALDSTWQSRPDGGDHFDGIFDTQTNLWDALNTVAKVGRAVCFVKDGKVRFVRDAEQSDIVASFSPNDMVKGSFRMQFLPMNEKTRNGLVIEYFSSMTWKQEEVLVTRDTPVNGTPERIKLFGCTSKAQALREAKFILNSDLYRRCFITFQTGLEALELSCGDLIEITHDMLQEGTLPVKKAKVLGIQPHKEGVVTIEAMSENPDVHRAKTSAS